VKLSWWQRFELWLYGDIDIVVSSETLHRRNNARLIAQHNGYLVFLPSMADHKKIVRRELMGGDE